MVPHEHFVPGREAPERTRLVRIWLFIIAITPHNFPEVLAVAVSLLAIGYTRRVALGVASLTGLVEPVGGLVGSAAVGLAAPLMPWTLGFAGGAMLFVISDEIIPETHRREHAAGWPPSRCRAASP